MPGVMAVVVQGLSLGRSAAVSVCQRLLLSQTGWNASPIEVGFLWLQGEHGHSSWGLQCVPTDGRRKVMLMSLVHFKMMDRRDLPMGEAFEQLRLLLDVFPVICYMKKEAKWAKTLKNKIEKLDSKQPGRPIFVALPRTLTCPHLSNLG